MRDKEMLGEVLEQHNLKPAARRVEAARRNHFQGDLRSGREVPKLEFDFSTDAENLTILLVIKSTRLIIKFDQKKGVAVFSFLTELLEELVSTKTASRHEVVEIYKKHYEVHVDDATDLKKYTKSRLNALIFNLNQCFVMAGYKQGLRETVRLRTIKVRGFIHSYFLDLVKI